MAQNTSTAVMERRAGANVEGDDAQRALWRKLNFFPTPPWAGRAVAEVIQSIEPMRREWDISLQSVWEPACGELHIAEPLREYFAQVWATDVHYYGCGQDELDFFNDAHVEAYFGATPDRMDQGDAPDWIITNPPFLKAADFVERGLKIARRGVAVLCRMAFLESAARYELLHGPKSRLAYVCPFIERVPMQLGSWDPELSSATAYAWFIFDKRQFFGGRWQGRAIPPGTKARLTRPDDVRRFARHTDLPLLPEGETK